MNEIILLKNKIIHTFKTCGIKGVFIKSKRYLQNRKLVVDRYKNSEFISGSDSYKDVLFISGCGEQLPHSYRYRVTHQKEQLTMAGMQCDDVYYTNLTLEMVRYYSMFVFYRCPFTEMIGDFIFLAKQQNKAVLFDVDDLVIDTKYTNQLPCVKAMPKVERVLYDDGIEKMKKTLSLCDAAITSTDKLVSELSQYVSKVFLNRNSASEEMIKYAKEALEQYSENKLVVGIGKRNKREIKIEKEKVVLGYFSGSLTHNDDFLMILPAIVRLMREFDNVMLSIVGELDMPEELEEFKQRLVILPYVDYRQLPKLIRSVDINLAPICENIFNEAKSENKWMEAALVKVPTIASDFGAFNVMIEHGVTGILCKNSDDDWYEKLKTMILSEQLREEIGDKAYQKVIGQCTTSKNAHKLGNYMSDMRKPTIVMVLPSTQISGGVLVALKHCQLLQQAGNIVTIAADRPTMNYMISEEARIPVIYLEQEAVLARIDKMIATMWCTVDYVVKHRTTTEKYYLVQGYEPGLYEEGSPEYNLALDTYCLQDKIKYITISKWCEKWLKERFSLEVRYAPNGIDSKLFYPAERVQGDKIRIIIEGDSSVEYKNVDESFCITNKLDKSEYEVWYLSYKGKPKDWYEYDRYFQNVPHEKMQDIYCQCDILLKSSYLESFSYPPLEMMATGGCVVVAPNDGNMEYLEDGVNCLLYQQGNIEDALLKIKELSCDMNKRAVLIKGGVQTAKEREWMKIKDDILLLYDVKTL